MGWEVLVSVVGPGGKCDLTEKCDGWVAGETK